MGSPVLHDADRDAPTAPTAIGALSRDEQISISAMQRLCPPGHNQAQNAPVLPHAMRRGTSIPAIFQMLACAMESDPGNRSSLAVRRVAAERRVDLDQRMTDAISIARYSTLASPDWRIP
jgi:hypothetical protein